MKYFKKIIRAADSLLNLMIELFFIPILLYGIYAVWDSEQIYVQADSSVYQTYRPVSDTDYSFTKLKEINPEVFGWLVVDGTNIDYPLVQSDNNSKYVNTDVEGEFSLSGSIFLDCRNSSSFTDLNNIIYGHHMQKEAMFGQIELFEDEKHLDKHRYGKIFYDSKWHNIEFFAFVHTDAYDTVLFNAKLSGTEGNKIYLDCVKEKSLNFRDLHFQEDEHYISLSTCTSTSTNGRHILIGRITDRGE